MVAATELTARAANTAGIMVRKMPTKGSTSAMPPNAAMARAFGTPVAVSRMNRKAPIKAQVTTWPRT